MNAQVLSEILKDKNILVTGGTGSFGHQIGRELFKYEPASTNIYSRDEKKQYDMAQAYSEYHNLLFDVGDVRDGDRTYESMPGIDIVFNTGALKQVPNCEYASSMHGQNCGKVCGPNVFQLVDRPRPNVSPPLPARTAYTDVKNSIIYQDKAADDILRLLADTGVINMAEATSSSLYDFAKKTRLEVQPTIRPSENKPTFSHLSNYKRKRVLNEGHR